MVSAVAALMAASAMAQVQLNSDDNEDFVFLRQRR